jgi:hypothetical protein
MKVKTRSIKAGLVGALFAASAFAACGGNAGGATSQAGTGFTTMIDNPWMPLAPGDRWVYRDINVGGPRQRDLVTVTPDTKQLANGVTARVVHDVALEKGKPVEDTLDYYAQDSRGNVWYLGEDTKELKSGKVVSTEGSFEAGVDGAKGGIVMQAHPRVGMSYRQEQYAGHAEDRAKVLAVDSQAEVPSGHYSPALLTSETSPLEPKVLELKFYGRGVGQVLALTASGGNEREELVSFHSGG